jgi:hypothetical protein
MATSVDISSMIAGCIASVLTPLSNTLQFGKVRGGQ